MAAVISLSQQDDDAAWQKILEHVSQLEHENKHLRELLQFTTAGILDINDCTTQTVCVEDSSPSSAATTTSKSDSTALHSAPTPPSVPAFPKHLSGNGPASGPTWNRFPTRRMPPRDPLLAMATSGSGSGSGMGTAGGEMVGGRPYEVTPINSGQNTPTLRDPRFDTGEPLLEQARDRLANTIS